MVQNRFAKQKNILKELILEILNENKQPIQKVKLAKLVLFAEIGHFLRTGESITNLYFVRLKQGPVIAFFDEVLSVGENKEWKKESTPIFIVEKRENRFMSIYSPCHDAKLPEKAKETIKEVLKKYGKKTGTELSLISHTLPAWKNSEPNEPIYLTELVKTKEADYFALTDIIEEIDDTKELEKNISPILSRT